MKSIAALSFVALALRVCGESPRSPAVNAPPQTEQVPVAAQAGVGVSAALTTNVTAQPDGTLIAEVRDPAGQPVHPHAITVEIRRPDEDPVPVVMVYDEPQHHYVGRITGITPGAYPVQVTVVATPAAQPVEIVAPPVTIVAVASPTLEVAPPTVAVQAPTAVVTAPTTVVAAPTVTVQQPTVAVVAPSVVVTPPSLVVGVPGVVVVDDHHHGRHRGHWRGRGHGRGRGGVFFGVFR